MDTIALLSFAILGGLLVMAALDLIADRIITRRGTRGKGTGEGGPTMV